MEPGTALVEEYVARAEEQQVLEQVELVRGDRTSRALLLYGVGGVGKTKLVRALAAGGRPGADVRWVPPVDLDDSNYWLLENLQRLIAEHLGDDNDDFRPFLTYLANLPKYVVGRVGRDTVASHHSRMREAFVDCYGRFVRRTGATVVVTLDTVETIRSTYLLANLTQLIKELPGTLFILSGRPTRGWEGKDTIAEYLEDPSEEIETARLELSGFRHDDAIAFLDSCVLGRSLSDADKARLVYLTSGHPLWLALAVDYVCRSGPPPEMQDTTESELVRDMFRSRLITPYRSTEYWPEAIKRLAVLRHSVDQPAWERIMGDRGLPPGVDDWDSAWDRLRSWPWIRPRANDKYVTLHDAFAEELASRLIPVHDHDETWRRSLWQMAVREYDDLIGDGPSHVRRELAEIFEHEAEPDEATLRRVDELDTRKRELDQRQTARLHYLLLCDFEQGTEQFDEQFSEAARHDDFQFQELVCHELEQFLPPIEPGEPQRDAIGVVVDQFQHWLTEQPGRYLRLGLNIARFLIHNSQPEPALSLLHRLPDSGRGVNVELRYRLANEQGNAWMRVPEEVEKAGEQFESAQEQARRLPSPDRERRLAQAFKELGYYFRNIGNWLEADRQYQLALREIKDVTGPGFPEAHREELASIQTNWAYLKALQGHYDEASRLVTSATRTRRKLGREHGVAVSLSVSGEVERYHRRFPSAWDLYQQAETIFVRLRNWPWMGLVLQEQAICLFQAADADQNLVDDPSGEAKLLITRAMDICRDQAIRWYPSALNRAGRIYGRDDPRDGLRYFDMSIEEARRVADGWFLSASLIEHLELSYRTWVACDDSYFRGLIDARALEAKDVTAKYPFKDFRGRWRILQGHLAVRDALASGRTGELTAALNHYSEGFGALADGQVGSYGREAVRAEFAELGRLYARLPRDVRSTWCARLTRDWAAAGGSELLLGELARLPAAHG